MTRQYRSFLVRVWQSDDGETRVEVEHVQSGKHVRLPSLLMAMVWLASYSGNSAPSEKLVEPPADHSRLSHEVA